MRMKKGPSYKFTRHAIERFEERFGHMIEKGASTTQALAGVFYNSEVDRSFLNNTKLMVSLGERYGYDKPFEIRVADDIVFICRQRSLITLYNRHNSVYGNKRRSRYSCRAVQ